MQDNKVKLIIFDWAGTMIDYGSQAPVDVFKRIFMKKGITLTKEQINKPMGMEKKAHIRALLENEEIGKLWKEKHESSWIEEDVEEIFQLFEKDLYDVVEEYCVPIDGIVDTLKSLKELGIKIGSTTGYVYAIMEPVLKKANEFGIVPDCFITPDAIDGKGRPTPFMIFECMKKLNMYPVSSVVKVGDTIMDILEGKNAGAITVGVVTGSNLLGLTKEEYNYMDIEELAQLKEETEKQYFEAGADFVIDNITLLPEIIDKINKEYEQ